MEKKEMNMSRIVSTDLEYNTGYNSGSVQAMCTKEDVYVNMPKRDTEEKLSKSKVKNKVSTTKEESTSNIIKAALVLVIILFLILVVITSVLLKYYWVIREEMNHQKNHESICTPCPAGWNMSGCSCYFVSEEETSWDEARDECFKKKAVLVMIKDKAESEPFNKYKGKMNFWIGLRRDTKDINIWKWLDGTPITYTNWEENQPDNYENKENCGEVTYWNGLWNDLPCDYRLHYICKM